MMNRLLTISAAALMLTSVSMSADAQGRRPSGAQPGGQRPTMGQPMETGRMSGAMRRQDAERMRQQSEQRRQAAEQRRAEARQRREQRRMAADERRAAAEQRRLEAQANNRSEEMRAAHPPNEHAADEAFLAELNAENSEVRDQRADLRADNRGDHGQE